MKLLPLLVLLGALTACGETTGGDADPESGGPDRPAPGEDQAGPSGEEQGAGEVPVTGHWQVDRAALLEMRLAETRTDLEGQELTPALRKEVEAQVDAFRLDVAFQPGGRFQATIIDPEAAVKTRELRGTWSMEGEEIWAQVAEENGEPQDPPGQRAFLYRDGRLSMDYAGRSIPLTRP